MKQKYKLLTLAVCFLISGFWFAASVRAGQFNSPDGSTYGADDSAFKLHWDEATDQLHYFAAPVGTAGNAITWADGMNMNTDGHVMFNSAGSAAAPLHVAGEVIIGDTGLACTAGAEGALRYIAASDDWEFCNGSAWVSLASGSGTGSAAYGTDGNIQFHSGGLLWSDSDFNFTANGELLINTATGDGPSTGLKIVGSGGNARDIKLYSYNNTALEGDIEFFRARGVEGGATTVASGDYFGGLRWKAWDGAAWRRTAVIHPKVSGAVSGGNVPTELRFNIDPTGSAIDDANTKMIIKNDGKIGIGTTSPDAELTVIGDIEYTGSIIDISDSRLKKDITPLEGTALDKLRQVQGYSFRMIDDPDGRIEFGVFAQELERIFPELVHTSQNENGFKSVNYIGLIAPMIEAMKEQQMQIEKLQQKVVVGMWVFFGMVFVVLLNFVSGIRTRSPK